jgi:pimeloyl-ACP methyl ester carboxylesterase
VTVRSQTTLLACAALVLAAAMLPSAHASEPQAVRGERVVLLHGLARSASSMSRMAKALERAGFDVCNVSYPSRKHAIEELAVDFVGSAVLACFPKDDQPVHFVTHSLGGVILRQLAASGVDIRFGRIVMLSPPSEGSEIVDKFADWWMFRKLNGPAGSELGTGVDSVPLRLGATSLDVGVITGDRSVNWILSTFIPGQDDGKVSVSRARLNGMHDFLVVHSSHPFIMRNAVAIDQTMCYLEHGQFERE